MLSVSKELIPAVSCACMFVCAGDKSQFVSLTPGLLAASFLLRGEMVEKVCEMNLRTAKKCFACVFNINFTV